MNTRDKYILVYDSEIYPNFSCFNFKDIRTKQRYHFRIFSDTEDKRRNINDTEALIDFLGTRCARLIGYNSEAFDDLLALYLYGNAYRLRQAMPEKVCEELYQQMNLIFAQQAEAGNRTIPMVYTARRKEKPWQMHDLLLLFNRVDRVSLKQLAIGMKWPRIQDLPIPPGTIIKYDQIDLVSSYCDNDVDITEAVMYNQQEQLNNRIEYTIKTGVNIMNDCESDIGKSLISNAYLKATGISKQKFNKGRTFREYINLKDCVTPKIRFQTDNYNKKVLKEVMVTRIDPNKDNDSDVKKQFEIIFNSKYLSHTMALGGLHSNNYAEIMEENDHYAYWDLDVASYYPRIIINDQLRPAHLHPIINTIYKGIVDDRVRLKKIDKVAAGMMKIAANAYYGQTKSKFSPFYDPLVAVQVCISGQLYLLMLMEALEKYSKCIVVYSNTDGLTVKVPRNEQWQFFNICRRWEAFTGFELEFNQYRKMVMRDVNNYLIFTYNKDEKDRIKAKGAYNWKKPIHKGYDYPIIATAVRDWFDKGIPVDKTIRECTDIHLFLKAERTSMEKFDVCLYPRNIDLPMLELQKNNRWAVTRGNAYEGKLYKITKDSNREMQEMEKDFYVTCYNDVIPNLPIHEYKLHYDYYIHEALALIHLTRVLNKETHVKPRIIQTQLALV